MQFCQHLDFSSMRPATHFLLPELWETKCILDAKSVVICYISCRDWKHLSSLDSHDLWGHPCPIHHYPPPWSLFRVFDSVVNAGILSGSNLYQSWKWNASDISRQRESNRGLEVKQVWDIPPAKCGKEGEECHPKWTLTTECRNGEARMGHEARTAKNVSAWLREICYVILLGSTTSGTQWPSYEGTVIFSLTVKISFDECFQQGENKKNQEMRA